VSKTKTHKASCHCGAVQVTIAHLPDYMQNCNCSLCRKSGSVWGYFGAADVEVLGETKSYQRRDCSEPAIQLHFCKTCGSTTHWCLIEDFKQRTKAEDRIGVNMRLFEELELVGTELRFPDGKNWAGDGAFTYRRDAIILSKGDDV